MNELEIVLAEQEDFDAVGKLVHLLLSELALEGEEVLSIESYVNAARELLHPGQGVWALVAKTQSGEVVGVLTLNECAAIYSCGRFGEISELYVDSSYRSSGIGAQFINAAKEFAKDKGWTEIEVCAPTQPKWKRTVEFYIEQGFKYSGPRLYLDCS